MPVEVLENANPLLEENGLSAKQQKKAIKRHANFERVRRETRGYARQLEAGSDNGSRIDDQLNLLSGKVALRASKAKGEEHYDRHQGAYQVEAVKTAAAEGYYTNFGQHGDEANLTEKQRATRFKRDVEQDIKSLPETHERS